MAIDQVLSLGRNARRSRPLEPHGADGRRRRRAPRPRRLQRTPASKRRSILAHRAWTSSASRCSCCSWPAAPSTCSSATSRRRCMLLGFVFVVMGITLYQERKTERALEALRDLSSPRAAGHPRRRREAHPGPRGRPRRLLVVRRGRPRAGRRGAARPRSTSPSDESLLTGESVPVRKSGRRTTRRPSRLGPAATTCRSSTPARWSCRARASPRCARPGLRTEIGKIGKALQTRRARRHAARSSETGRLVRNLAVVGPVAVRASWSSSTA